MARTQTFLRPQPADAATLTQDWSFRSSRPRLRQRVARWRSTLLGRIPFPAHTVLRAVSTNSLWCCYFVYLPDDTLTNAHRFTVTELRRQGFAVLVLCACSNATRVPAELYRLADAIVWKDLPGYDFSGYALGLRLLAANSPGADVLVLNDSVLGPFADLREWLGRARWDITAFTASGALENHIQSYAFFVRALTVPRLHDLAPAITERWAARGFRDAVYLQETQLGRIAARRMTVGAFWYGAAKGGQDPVLSAGPSLVERGMPFLKRSFFGKFHDVHEHVAIRALLAARGHPPLPSTGPGPAASL